jgi:hypothetical protein
MATYFLHVIDTSKNEDDEGRDVLWIGTTPGEIYDIGIIVNATYPHLKDRLDIPIVKLYRDANE